MKQTKFISALRVLSRQELNQFKDFVWSPYFNKNEKSRKLVACILPFFPGFEDNALEKKNIYPKIYGKSTYNETRINNLISYTYQLLESFIANLHIDANTNPDIPLLYQLHKMDLGIHFDRAKSRVEKRLQEKHTHDSQFYYQKFQLASITDDRFLHSGIRKHHESLQEKSDHLDLYYLIEKLKVTCEMLNRQMILNQSFDIKLIKFLEKSLESDWSQYKKIPIIRLYYMVYKSLTEPEKENHYTELVTTLGKKIEKISQSVARELYDFAQNYCIRRINSGQTAYQTHILKLYKDMINNEMIMENGIISEWDYKNIVTIAIRLEDHAWTEDFINRFKDYLAPEVKENAHTYNLAMLYYSMKEYSKSLQLLLDVEFSDVFYHLGAKTTLLKIYFEEMEAEAFHNLYDTFNTYLFRNKLISESQRISYKNMLRCAKKAFYLKSNYSYLSDSKYSQQTARLKYMMQHAQQIANINWLNEIVESLEPARQINQEI